MIVSVGISTRWSPISTVVTDFARIVLIDRSTAMPPWP